MKKSTRQDILTMILTVVVLSVVSFFVRDWVSGNLNFRVPDAVGLQELAVKELSGSPRGSSWRNWCRVGDDYVLDHFALINFDKVAGTAKMTRADVVHHHIKHVADFMIFICFAAAAGVLCGFFVFWKSKYYYVYLPWLALISLSFAVVVNRQCRQLNVEYEAKNFAELCDRDSVEQLLRLIDDAESSGRREFRGHQLFIGKNKNFGIDFAAVTVGDCEYIYIVKDDPTPEQLNDSPPFWSWRKTDDHIYRCRHDKTRRFIQGVRSKLTGCRYAFVLLFLLCIGATLGNAAMALMHRKPAGGNPGEA